MPSTDPFVAHVLEMMAPFAATAGEVRARRMFGGWGLSVDGMNFGIIISDRLYLKADDENREAFVEAGREPFVYEARGKAMTLQYWSAPESCLESPAEMTPWARLAYGAALRKANRPARRGPARKRASGKA
jgi:DNA transformation protein